MALADGLVRLGASATLLLRQRLELAAVDVEEEVLRLGALLAAGLAVALLGTLALAALAALVVVLCWDSARVAALVGIALAFTLACGWAAWRLALALRRKPAFMAATLTELARDGEQLSALAP